MDKETFTRKWEVGLEQYLIKLCAGESFPRTNGFTKCHRDGTPATHGYIINKKDNESDIDVIKRYNILCCPDDFKRMIGKVDYRDRHLNSSQVVCYNFFRNMMAKDIAFDKEIGWYGYASEALIEFVKNEIGITITQKAICKFEYEDKETQQLFKSFTSTGLGEKSQFDFFISDGDTRIYFEIKYKEDSFGSWVPTKSEESTKNHALYLERGYKPMVENSTLLTQNCKESILVGVDYKDPNIEFNRFYQLFRNVLKADECHCYSVFIFPAANPGPKAEYEDFLKYLNPVHNHIIPLLWENLSRYMSYQFYEKYISFLEDDMHL